MGVEEGHGGGGLLRVLELADTHLEPCDVFAHDLRPRLALAVVIFADVALLRADALSTGGFRAVAPLPGGEQDEL